MTSSSSEDERADPFHAGERAVQARAGEEAMAWRHARMIQSQVPRGAWEFVAAQPWLVVGVDDQHHRRWASVIIGHSHVGDDGALLTVVGEPRAGDEPFTAALTPGRMVGVLYIDLATRRRLRINGVVTGRDATQWRIAVREAYPNCPKYIQARTWTTSTATTVELPAAHDRLDAAAAALLQRADTLFLATGHDARGADVSHRGGPPGFVVMPDDRHLVLPDYAGNGLFNSLGNLASDPRCGVLVPDFAHGRLLEISGQGELRWDVPDPYGRSGGTGRFVQVQVEAVRWSAADRLRAGAGEPSPFLPPTR